MTRIAAFHLFNDFSGSPMVFATALQAFLRQGVSVDLYSTQGGPLDALNRYDNFHIHPYRYAYSANPLVTTLRYSAVQLLTFFKSLRYSFSRDTLFYINTILPIGPALAARLTGHRVIYHYHENAAVKSGLYRVLARAMERIASDIICVSAHQASTLKRTKRVHLLPNCLDPSFSEKLRPDIEASFNGRNVLMLSSLKGYKGTREFITLASMVPDANFTLVINDTQEHVAGFLKGVELPANLTVHSRIHDVSPIFNKAAIIVNLSDPRRFVETFGMTALEAMTAGKPVIVPPVGGIAEIVTEGVNGFKIDSAHLEQVATTIHLLLTDKTRYSTMAQNALHTAAGYSVESYHKKLLNICL